MNYRLLLAGLPLLLTACMDEVPEVPQTAIASPPALTTHSAGPIQITLTAEQADELDIQTTAVTRSTVTYTLSVPGEVRPAPDHYALVSAPISGRVVAIYAHEGEYVTQGSVLADLESLEFANLVADYLQVQADVSYLENQVERLTELVDKKITPRNTLDRTQADLTRSRALMHASYARLRALGLEDLQLTAWANGQMERPVLPVTAPLGGVINEHDIELGQSVTAYEQMLNIINPRQVRIVGFVPPEEAAVLQSGDTVLVGGRHQSTPLVATISTINPALDDDNKSVVINILTPTRQGWPRMGQPIRLQVQVSPAAGVLRLPLHAVQYDGEQPTVFVRLDARTYEKRAIQVDRLTAEEVLISGGVQEGEAVAITQVFSLKALERYALFAE